jgi:asparagine synthase (glutamine-hydrolysing)
MCGFIAILQDNPVIDTSRAPLALNALAHRGPDGTGEWRDGHVFLGHRRLAIIDLATGEQPMQSSDGRHVIVFNGEIYNFPELRELLAREGIRFRTHSDTEVILEGYRRWGRSVTDRIRGIFAFVIWDALDKTAFGARDRLGIKPLCWAMRDGALVVSSTLEPFGAIGGFDQLDMVAVRDLMTFDYIPAPRSIFQGICKLEPGTRFEWRFGDTKPTLESYWTPPEADPALSAPDEPELEQLLERAVRGQMISDVPIGAFLSGGIDSSLLVAFMARNSGTPVRTFSVAFPEKGFDESPIAALVAQRFATNHTLIHAEDVRPQELLDLLGRLDEPMCDPAFVPTYVLSELTRRHVKVALSGDGGDEVFGGYSRYLIQHKDAFSWPLGVWIHPLLQAVPWRFRGASHAYWHTLSAADRLRFSMSRYGDFPVFRKDLRQLLSGPYRDAAAVPEFFQPWEQVAHRYGTRLNSDVFMRTDLTTYLSANCLVKTDRASMLASLEVRVPFLDEMVLDRIVPLPAEKKIVNGELKALLLPIARRLLPREVWDRPKHGFNIPIDRWLGERLRPAVETALDWGESHFNLFNYDYLRRLHRINVAERGVSTELWNPFVLLAWAMARKTSTC